MPLQAVNYFVFKVKVFEKEFNQFNTGKTDIEDHKERLFLCFVGEKADEYESEEKINGYAKSPLNYTGGKYKLLPQLLEKFPNNFNTFITKKYIDLIM